MQQPTRTEPEPEPDPAYGMEIQHGLDSGFASGLSPVPGETTPALERLNPTSPDLGSPTQEGGFGSGREGGGGLREELTAEITNFHEYDSLVLCSSNHCQHSGASLEERPALTQSMSQDCCATGCREVGVVRVGLGINRGKQGGVSTATVRVPGIGP